MLADVRTAAGRRPSETSTAVVVVAILATLTVLSLVAAAPVQAATRVVEKGVSFTSYSSDAYDGSGARASLSELRATGATWAMVLVTVYQDNINSVTISRTGPQTPTDASLQGIVAYAHKIGLKVMLKPQVDLLHDSAHSRSQIGLVFSKAAWTAWFGSYNETIVHYAQLAADTHCEQFSVGCELDSTVAHEAAWRHVIADVRAVYPGIITYAADLYTVSPSDVKNVQWWDAVDLIGVDMYPTLSIKLHPTVAELDAGWRPHYAALYRLHLRWHKPVIFTEIGIRSIVGAARAPWDWQRTGAVDLVGQKRWYKAALQTFATRSWMKGLFFWTWSPYLTDGGPHDRGYSPRAKLAGVVLHYWFTDKLRQ